MQSKLTVSKPSVLVCVFCFCFLKVILCEIKGQCLELLRVDDGWMNLGFTFLSTVFQKDGRVNMKGYVQ